MKEEIKLQDVCGDILNKNRSILSIILIGSRARGDFKENSDYDLMFIVKRDVKTMKKYETESEYNELISKKANIDNSLISAHLWSADFFKKEYKKGNSFVYCALRDGKAFATRKNSRNLLNLKLPNCKLAGMERIKWAKRNIGYAKFSLNFWKKREPNKKFSGSELENLGYCAMHLCWGICMINNFCPLSKYTALNESRRYFHKKEFETIKKAYRFYSHQDIYRRINKRTFIEIYGDLNKIIKRLVEKEK